MKPKSSGQLKSSSELRQLFADILSEQIAGFIDFDFAGKKRRLFIDNGTIAAAQSGVPGENLADFLVKRGRIDSVQRDQALQAAKANRQSLDQVFLANPALSAEEISEDLANLAHEIASKCLAENGGDYQLTEKAGVGKRFGGRPLALASLLGNGTTTGAKTGTNMSAVATAEHAPSRNAEIHEAFAAAQKQSAYELLKLPTNATNEQIKSRYFELAKRWHSDSYAGQDLSAADSEALQAIFAAIADAYRLLLDPNARANYDLMLERKQQGLPTDFKQVVSAEAHFNKGHNLLDRGEFAAAFKELAIAVEENAGEAEFWLSYGLAMYLSQGSGKVSEATAAIEKGLKLNDKLGKGYDYLGRIYKGEGALSKAKTNFNKCLQLEPGNISAQRELRLMAMRHEKEQEKKKSGQSQKLFDRLFRR